MVSTFQWMEILALKTSLALDSQKKFENKELEALLEEDQSQTQACRIIGGNSTRRFCTVESHENDLKTRKLGTLWTETERHWKVFHLWIADSKTIEKRFFASDCDWRWEVDILRQPQEEKNTTLSPVNRCHRPQHQHHGRTFMVWKSCSISDGTKRILFTMSCWNLAIPLRAIGIGYNWFVCVHCKKNGRNTSKW